MEKSFGWLAEQLYRQQLQEYYQQHEENLLVSLFEVFVIILIHCGVDPKRGSFL